MMRTIREVIHNQRVLTLSPDASVRVAARAMAEHRVGSVMVIKHDRLVGIITERDCLTRVLAAGVDPDTTELSAVMTRKVISCRQSDTVAAIMEMMTTGKFRHLPVVEGDRVVGLISIGDIVKWRVQEYENEQEALRQYIKTA